MRGRRDRLIASSSFFNDDCHSFLANLTLELSGGKAVRLERYVRRLSAQYELHGGLERP